MHVELEPLPALGKDLHRPECVVVTRSGDTFVSDERGGVSHLPPGSPTWRLYRGASADLPEPLAPNGFCLEADGSFLIAHLGAKEGGVFRLTRSGQLSPVLRSVDGVALPPTNFVTRDRSGKLWTSVSTRRIPRARDYNRQASSGFIVLDTGTGPRIVADQLGYTNECVVSPDGKWLYVAESCARRLSRFALRGENGLGPRETVTDFGSGDLPDGLTCDEEGHIWVTCPLSNRLLRVAPGGDIDVVIETTDLPHVEWIEAAYQGEGLTREHMMRSSRSTLGHISSIAFGGQDRRTVHLGCLLGKEVARFASPIAGAQPAHWDYH